MQTNADLAPSAPEILPPVQRLLNNLHERYVSFREGEVATYIPELSKADPEWFGIAVVTMDGHVYMAGDCDIPFTIQSISKPFVYGLALEDHGWEHVLDRIGLEPTGDAFNAISLDPETGRPANPMINAGAIATTALVDDGDEGAINRILRMFARYAGHDVEIDEEVYRSESTTGHRNRAISHLLRNFDHMPDDPEAALDVYFRQCSIKVTCRDLAVMAASLANGGVNPITGERVLEQRYVDSVLSVMETCGMYNYAGEWMYRVGMPAKSGVAGGIVAPLVGQIGIGVFSPRLDARGNSVRGVLVCDDLSREYRLHMLNVPNISRSTVRARYDVTEIRSKRHRPHAADLALAEHGDRVRIYELQGQLNFAALEVFSRDVADAANEADFIGIDFKRVLRADPGAISLFVDLLDVLLDADKRVALSDAEHVHGLAAQVESISASREGLVLAENCDRAIEHCEDMLLAAVAPGAAEHSVPLEENEFFAGLTPEAIASITAKTVRKTAGAGQVLIHAGDKDRTLLLFTEGRASVTMDVGDGEHVRLATNPAGSTYGEILLVDESAHPADVTADTEVEFYKLAASHLLAIGEANPAVMAVIMRNVAVDLAAAARSATAELRALHAWTGLDGPAGVTD